ncbi:hypothetical protein [Nocardia crassostreae]|uniref:hypothetical protein n=1 Tax=Nocardia crassostreae TaxID=53428 RepID=UPI001FDF6666|nr:hypothetical protein [Nocardia crassostreae]
MSRPASTATIGTTSGPGAIARPVCSADHPHTFCDQSTPESSIPAKAILNSSAFPIMSAKFGSRSRAGSTTGLAWRREDTIKAPARTTATANPPSTPAELHPQSSPFTSARMNAATEPISMSAPNRSGRLPPSPAGLGSNRSPTINAASPIGTFTRNTQRQCN